MWGISERHAPRTVPGPGLTLNMLHARKEGREQKMEAGNEGGKGKEGGREREAPSVICGIWWTLIPDSLLPCNLISHPADSATFCSFPRFCSVWSWLHPPCHEPYYPAVTHPGCLPEETCPARWFQTMGIPEITFPVQSPSSLEIWGESIACSSLHIPPACPLETWGRGNRCFCLQTGVHWVHSTGVFCLAWKVFNMYIC